MSVIYYRRYNSKSRPRNNLKATNSFHLLEKKVKLSLYLIKHSAMKTYGGVEV
jgi:hypothetical protein